MHYSWLASAIFVTTLLATAQAQETGQPLWEAGVFAGGVSTPAYPGSVDRTQRALALPFFVYRGEVLRADRSGVGARVLHTSKQELDIGFAAALPASSNDVAARQGMPDLGTLIEFGPRYKVTLAQGEPGTRLRLELPLRAVLEFKGGVRDQGAAFEPALVFEKHDMGNGWSMGTSAGLVFGDQRLNQYFYGVEAPYATASRPEYEARAGLIATRLGLSSSKALTPDLRLAVFVRYENYGGAANLISPLHLAPNGTSAGVGLTWTLARSQQRAKD